MSVHLPKGLLSRFARAGRTVEVQTVDEPTIYTIGPAAGSYDVEWPDNDNATPSEDYPVQAVVIGGVAYLMGQIEFSGAPSGGLGITVPEVLWPAQEFTVLQAGYDSSAPGSTKFVSVYFSGPDSEGTFSGFGSQFTDGSTFASGDRIYLAHAYVLASAVS